MVSFRIFFVASLFATSAARAADPTPEPNKTVTGTVYYCHDGDTCHVGVAEAMWFNVRLAGIDAPEVQGRSKKAAGQELGDQSRDYLNGLLKGKTVTIRQVDLDPYNRPVVELTLDGKLVNTQLLEQGFAEMYRGKTKRLDKPTYEAAEKTAKDAKRGIWGLARYVSPKEFRSQQKK